MNWDLIKSNWKKLKGNVRQRWGMLNKNYPICKIDESRGSSKDQRDQIGTWQNRQVGNNHSH